MQTWTAEMWQAALISLVVGFIIGYFLLRITKESAKKQVKTEAELRVAKEQLESQKQQLEKHFAESADLLKSLAQNYQKLYQHLAQSSTRLLPELNDKSLFQHNLLDDKGNPINPQNTDDQPKDYSEGSSGLFKAEK
ncbi:hypothetical protein SC1083_0686 [Aggregatibacter actinomycetemcomitans serotype e str. SC1083]|uniref:Z-ring associated protein G n=1 Tax=Aggregatibacter actinomycetemcomitans serotype e str. SC1083 TaxID=907488 RepID=G4A794_AGGAC|nr:DUF1043 family protein [Aggregatibacter actinomycetemcomitans]EGY34298.1 hypothetical protein SC1083_0686 [Aggregatibacter actinomycetemcomitans serotype e str. SC1083]